MSQELANGIGDVVVRQMLAGTQAGQPGPVLA
jgi:hypothetical protein